MSGFAWSGSYISPYSQANSPSGQAGVEIVWEFPLQGKNLQWCQTIVFLHFMIGIFLFLFFIRDILHKIANTHQKKTTNKKTEIQQTNKTTKKPQQRVFISDLKCKV